MDEYPPWDDLRLFLAVAEKKSFSGAARQLRVGQPTVSRRIAQLEDRLAEALFVRGADGAVLTPAGERLLAPARRMAESASELWRLASQGEARPEGLVRIAAPPGLAFDFLAPFARHVAEVHPELRLEVLSAVEHLDLGRGEADLALRSKRPQQRDLISLCSLDVPAAAFATRAYRRRLRRGYGPGDVDWITWAPPYDRLPPRPQLEAMIPGFVPIFTSDSYLVQVKAAEEGLGAVIISRARHRYQRPGGKAELVELDLPLHGARGELHLVCAKSMQVVPRVRAVIALLLDELKAVEHATFTLGTLTS